MEIFLGKITQHAMNYAIRSGIAITSTYAIKQCSRLLKTVDNASEFQELQLLQERLDSKIRIISPAIDMIELISARGNTSLESAVFLTKAIRWDIQALALRLTKAANAQEVSQRSSGQLKSGLLHKAELRSIVEDIKQLLLRIEDAVPLINLAITTSGASLSTSLPATVSPSRLLQASTFLTAGDTQFSIEPTRTVQIGPAFILSLYMLFNGHAHRAHVSEGRIRDTTWKEVIHKARVKLIRVPFAAINNQLAEEPLLLEESKANEFAYRLEIVEDLDDDRAHSFEDNEPQPGMYQDVKLAGIREFVPIHEVSKIFYADTGKILNIANEGESNSPVLLLKRDVNAIPPRWMMERSEKEPQWDEEPEVVANENTGLDIDNVEVDNPQLDIDNQLRRESLLNDSEGGCKETKPDSGNSWRLPPNLDPEWLALEVYTDSGEENSGDEQDINDDSTFASEHPSSSAQDSKSDSDLLADMANLRVNSPPAADSTLKVERDILHQSSGFVNPMPTTLPFGAIRSSLSLLEMLIRLTALQQFQQASHLSIPDELLTFFLEESSTTGAGTDGEERRRKRRDARQKVGFDPYDESPVKRRGEEYQYQNHGQDRRSYQENSRAGTPYDDYDPGSWYAAEPQYLPRDRTTTPQASPGGEPWLLRSREHTSEARSAPQSVPSIAPSDGAFPSSPQSPYVPPPPRRGARVQQARGTVVPSGDKLGVGSPLGRARSADADSSLGTSPGSPSAE